MNNINLNIPKIVAVVPIKLHSQRLPNKMMLPLGKKVLCQHIFDTLLQVQEKYPEMEIYCYCSQESIKSVLPLGVKFLLRELELDSNTTKGMDIYQSFANKVPADIYLLAHATSPFISSTSIIKGLQSVEGEYDSAFAVSKIKTFCWYQEKPLNYSLNDIVRTQNIEPIYWETSAFYIFTASVLNNKRRIGKHSNAIETDRIESIDIDDADDYHLACQVVK